MDSCTQRVLPVKHHFDDVKGCQDCGPKGEATKGWADGMLERCPGCPFCGLGIDGSKIPTHSVHGRLEGPCEQWKMLLSTHGFLDQFKLILLRADQG